MLEIIRGDTTDITVTITDENGSAVDITGATVYFTIKSKISDDDSNSLIQKEITNHTDPINGKTTISLSATETAEFPPDNYVWDLQIKFPDGTVTSAKYDKLVVLPDVTRTT